MFGLGPRRTRYAGASGEVFPIRKRFKKGGGGSSAPPSIDPIALGAAQLNSNLETAKEQSRLSNVNTTSPLGTTTFTPGPNDQWSLNQQLTPGLNTVLYGQENLATTLPSTANNIGQFLTEPAYAGIRLAQNAANTIGPEAWASPRPDLQTGINFSGLGALPSPNVQSSLDFSGLPTLSSPNFQQKLDFSGLGTLPTNPSDFSAPIAQAQKAAYNTQTGFLDPQFAQKESDLRQQLADQGIGVGTQAYSRATGDLGRQETLAYQQAQNAAVGAGNAEQAQLFNEMLGGRQQQAGEIATGGQFTNAAQQQQVADQLAARAQALGQVQAGGQFANAADQQRVADILAARGQGSQELATGANFANASKQQSWQDPLTALASLAGTGSGLYGSVAQDLATLNPLSGFEWAGALPTFGGSPTAVSPANIVGAGQVATNAAANRFAAGNTLNNQLFNGLGSLGGALGLGNGGLGNLLGLGSSASGLGSLFGSGAADFGGGGAALGVADQLGSAAEALAPLGWIICTELMRQGKMPKRHWIAGAPSFAAYPEDVKRGYYFWAIPTVRHLRRSPSSLFSRAVGAVFRWRAENIAAHKGVKGARKLWRGAAVTAALYPICKMLGRVVGERDWRSVYEGEIANG